MNEQLIQSFQIRIDNLEKKMSKFTENFIKDPHYALDWSQDTFGDAARLNLLKTVVLVLPSTPVEQLLIGLKERVNEKSRNIGFSTSVTSNLINRFDLSETAKLVDEIENYIQYGKKSIN